jgi:hypothetical protein
LLAKNLSWVVALLLGYRENTGYFSSNFSADEHVGINCGGIGRLKHVFLHLKGRAFIEGVWKESVKKNDRTEYRGNVSSVEGNTP